MRVGRRSAPRKALTFPCHVYQQRSSMASICMATNLSSRGIWLGSVVPLEIGDCVQLSFAPPGWTAAQPLVCLAAVRRAIGGLEGGVAGMGLEFYGIAPSQQRALIGYLYGAISDNAQDSDWVASA